MEPSIARSSAQDGNDVFEDYFNVILERIGEMEKQQQRQSKATEERLSQLQNDQKKLLEKISELEKQQKEQQNKNTEKAISNKFSKTKNGRIFRLKKFNEFEKEQRQRKNYWDANDCHENLEISGDKNLTIHYKENDCGWCSVFAEHSISLNNNSPDIFYYEISVKNMKNYIFFGFTVKRLMYESISAYDSDGLARNNGEITKNAKYSYDVGDTVGIGVNSATRQIFFTKNGIRLDSSAGLFIAQCFADYSFHPFISLRNTGDKIEANFGPQFKFDLNAL
ncbi:hypothetical protein niasHT_012584 [Heterodera trifolii]|uniref:SPRY domain-containing protein n=1 Tax=Heterodera trifolii TaxID=157864 RepID=A0ABD2L1D6_9BILA